MHTISDWITMGIFCLLIILYLHRSVDVVETRDSLWQYLAAACGCALTDWVGNKGHPVMALGSLALTLSFIHYVLDPFSSPRG